MKGIHNIYRRAAMLCLLLCCAAGNVWGQDRYENNYQNQTIQHKFPNKWYQLRDNISQAAKDMDTFNDEESSFTNPYTNTQIQAAHTYIDTLYVKKGSDYTLTLPTVSQGGNNNSARKYQRWYNFRTEGLFRVNSQYSRREDLLTPKDDNTTVFRFQNGYVGGNDLISVRSGGGQTTSDIMFGATFYYPTDSEYQNWNINNGTGNNEQYIVACDLSGYTDFTETFSESGRNPSSESEFSDNWYEPTLSLRAIYVIIGVDNNYTTSELQQTPEWFQNGYGRLFTSSYQGGYGTGKKFLEEYNITFPADHISNFTDEIVALSKSAQNYGGETLTASIVNNTNTAGIMLVSETNNGTKQTQLELRGDTRVIAFRKDGVSARTAWEVEDNSQATIIVTKRANNMTYNIARFNLTFKKETRLLTQHQLQRIDNDDAQINGEDWNIPYRTPTFLRDNYQLLTSRTFDYDPDVANEYGQNWYYQFPLDWNFSSYAFFDGSTTDDFDGSTKNHSNYNRQPFAEWGNYAITNTYVGYGDITGGEPKDPVEPYIGGRGNQTDESEYFLYVDASDLPGTIVTLPFTENLCEGTELFVSAWVKSAGAEGSDDAAMLFTIFGVKGEGDNQTKTPLYRQSTGQIMRTTWLSNENNRRGEYTDANGYGNNQNDWYQIYFSFINKSDEHYDSYEVKIDNNSASTGGGDFYLDDIEVFIAQPNAEVSQMEASCSTERTRMNFKLDWERLLSRTGGEEGATGTEAIDFCFIDQLKYNQYVEENASNPANPTDAEIIAALNYAIETIGDGQNYDSQIATLHYYLDYNENRDYNDPDLPPTGPLAINNYNEAEDRYYAYRLTEDDIDNLAVDFYATLSPNRLYWLLMNINNGYSTPTISDFVGFMDPCAIKTEFRVTSLNLVKVNGEVLNPGNQFCAGQHFDFSVDLRIPIVNESGDAEEYITVTDGVNFDWFFGTEEEFLETNHIGESYNGVSLAEALTAFREFYPEAKAVDENNTPIKTTGLTEGQEAFTQQMFDIVKAYSEMEGASGGMHNRLVLCEAALPITLLESGLDLVIKPIRTELPPIESISPEQWALVCWDHIVLNLEATGKAPAVYPGFNSVAYPGDGQSDVVPFKPNIRIGLAQIKQVTDSYNTLTINLREASLVTEGADYIGLIDDVEDAYNNPYMTYMYLTETDDPNMEHWLTPVADDPDDPASVPSFDQYSLPVGVITNMWASLYQVGSYTSQMKVYFDLTGALAKAVHPESSDKYHDFIFTPREGYTYTFTIHFAEKFRNGDESSNACFGVQTIKFLVVPEYLVWNDTQKGDGEIEIGNWNNDGNWKRATNDDIQATNTIDEYNNDNRAFVPMLFSKVIMPKDSKVHLYTGGFTNRLWSDDRPDYVGTPTNNIEYDLMTYEHTRETASEAGVSTGDLKTERYRVALCDQIHFKPGAEMLHAEYLLYNTAWVDYELDGGRWHTLASPLQGVVAGDFYTDESGTEESEYFTDINFNITDNNRFNPSVYQRGWKNSTTEVNLYTDGSNHKNVAISGNWSSLYNDVDEAYAPGTGFSLKVQDLNSEKALFRLPKADEGYYYFNYNNGTPTQGTDKSTIDRGQDDEGNSLSGRLMSDKIYHRTETNTSYSGSVTPNEITVTLSESANGDYYLVGNPFMAHLNMKAFFETNGETNGILENKYWYVAEDGVQNIVAESDDKWVSTLDNATIPPLRSFFVKKKDGETGDVTITFTHEMQVLGSDETSGDNTNTETLVITAQTSDGKTSRAAIAYDMAADKGYASDEDAELFLDSNLSDVPTIYTVAGTMATSINRTSELYNIPVGIYGNSTEMVTLSFEGLKNFGSATLYDAEKRTETPLREGTTLTVPASTSGRYFLRVGAPTANEQIKTSDIQIYTLSDNRVMVTSTTPLKNIRVYTINGALVRQAKSGFCSHELYLPDGIYVITAENANGQARTAKLNVN